MGISIILLPAIGGIVAIPLATIGSILGGTAPLTGSTSEMISMRWTKRRKKEFRARIKLIEEYKNKLYFYMQKEDGIITIEEVKQFDKLLAEFNNKLLELKYKQTKKDYNMISGMSQSGTFIPQEVLQTDLEKAQRDQ